MYQTFDSEWYDFTLFFLLSLNHIVTLSVCKVTTKQGLLRNFIWLESWKTNSDRTRSYIIGKQDWNWPTHSPVIRAQIELTSNLFNSRFVPFDRLSTVATSKQLCYNHKLGENFFFFTNIWNTVEPWFSDRFGHSKKVSLNRGLSLNLCILCTKRQDWYS